MSDTLDKDQWIARVLGKSYARPTPFEHRPGKQVKFSPVVSEIVLPKDNGIRLGDNRPMSGKQITLRQDDPEPQRFEGENGRKLVISKSPTGGTLFTAPPPPVRELTFSGGGGKGVALGGAVKSLEENGVLKDVKKVTGSSVGAMTSALVAAGIKADDFTELMNTPGTTTDITEGRSGLAIKLRTIGSLLSGVGTPLDGQGLEDVVGGALKGTLGARIQDYLNEVSVNGADPAVLRIRDRVAKDDESVTFQDMRDLSAVIPAIKEVVITGTYAEEFWPEEKKGKDGDDGNAKLKRTKVDPQLFIFSADSEPNLPVAKAVHASAAFPGAFKPVDIKLESLGITVRFIDGGAMNNTPTTASIGSERDLDPMPDKRGMTFVFEDPDGESKMLLDGVVKPGQGKGALFQNKLIGAQIAANEFSMRMDVSEKRNEIVEVPLTIEYTKQKKGKSKTKEKDMRGLWGGTLEFFISEEAKLELQAKTREVTDKQIARENEPKTREFASDSQMFVSIGMSDLATLAQDGYPAAAAAVTFRQGVAAAIKTIKDAAAQGIEKAISDDAIKNALDDLDQISQGDVDFQGYVAREMNKGGLDTIIDALRKTGHKSDVLDATFMVADALKVHATADHILKTLVYPKMTVEKSYDSETKEIGTGIGTLKIVMGLLRAAKTNDDLNLALETAIKHFKTKRDRRPFKRGHKEFAKKLEQYITA